MHCDLHGDLHCSSVSPDSVVAVATGLGASTVLHLGSGGGRFAPTLVAAGIAVVDVETDAHASLQLAQQFDVVWLSLTRRTLVSAAVPRSVVHTAAQHLGPGAFLVIELPPAEAPEISVGQLETLCEEFELTPHEAPPSGDVTPTPAVRVFRRTTRFTVHDLVFEARSSIERIDVHELARRLRRRVPPLLLDSRSHIDRMRSGVIAGAVHAPRTVLEWHLDPANGYRHPAVRSLGQALVVICNGGYSSSLAAANLVRLGFTDVCDVIGGHHAWCAAGLPLAIADHSHLDL